MEHGAEEDHPGRVNIDHTVFLTRRYDETWRRYEAVADLAHARKLEEAR